MSKAPSSRGDRRTATDADERAARAGGRPLDPTVDAAILDAAWRLLREQGYARMSIARVAEAAGVGRPAIYRRYRDKAELVLAVIEDKRARVPPIDTGDTRKDLIAHLEFARRKFDMSLAGTLLVEEGEHPELLRDFREGMIRPRMGDAADALRRGQARGDVRVDLDVDLATEALMGTFVYHYLAVGRPKAGWAERVVDQLWPAFAAVRDS
jgi:AcrR family transcriptional regulator